MQSTTSKRVKKFFDKNYQFQNAPFGSREKMQAREQLEDEILNRRHADYSINHIGELLFGHANSSEVLNNVRRQGQSLIDDWGCFRTFVSPYFHLSPT